MPWGTSGHCLLMIVQLCLPGFDEYSPAFFILKSFFRFGVWPKSWNHYDVLSVFSQSLSCHSHSSPIFKKWHEIESRNQLIQHFWFSAQPCYFSIWYPEVNIWPWLALNRLQSNPQWRLKYWIESRLVNSTNSLPIHFILSDYII